MSPGTKSQPANSADDRPVARRGVDLLALERVPDALAGVLARPDAAEARSLFLPDRDQRLAVLRREERVLPTLRRRQSVGKLTEEVVLPLADHTGMVIAAADHAELVGVGSEFGVQFQSQLERRAGVTACQRAVRRWLLRAEINGPPAFEIGEFVGRREEGMGLAVTLDLRHLHERLVADARLGIGPVHRFSFEGLRREHDARAQVRVVRDGQHRAARLRRVGVHVLPQVRRVLAVEEGKGNDLAHAVQIVAENDGAMKVLAAGRGGPFEAVQRGENTRLVPLLGRRSGVHPGLGHELVASNSALPVPMPTTASMAALVPSAGLVL